VRYLLFGGNKDLQGGAHDFYGAHDTISEARQWGLDYYADRDVRLGSWMHLAEFDGEVMRVLEWLNLPGSERAETDTLEWRPY
jgi:hypothetical protein